MREEAPVASATLFGSDNPAEALERMTVVARTLTDVVRAQNLVVRIGQSDHVRVEGWTFCGSLLGVFPIVQWTRPVLEGDTKVGWEARVEARTRSGELVGSGEAECLRDERTWKGRDDYALRSMAQTRATSKALRGPLGFVMQLGGFNPTPAEEMPVEGTATRKPVEQDREFPPVNPETGEIIEAGSDPMISAAQRTRLWAIAKDAAVSEQRLRELVKEYAGVDSTKQIRWQDYDALCEAVAAEVFKPQFEVPESAK